MFEGSRAYAAMLSVSRAVASGASLDSVLDAIATAAASVVARAMASSIVLLTPESGELRLRGSHGLPTEYRRAVVEQPSLLRQSASALATKRGRAVRVDDVEDHPVVGDAWLTLMRAAGIRSMFASPLEVGDVMIGALCLYRGEAGPWTALDEELIQFCSENAASAARTASLMENLSDQVRALGRLLRGLQEQNHEHANRLHALHGLLALGEYEEAMRFLSGLADGRELVSANVDAAVDHPTLAGLLVAEAAIAAQRGVRLEVLSSPGRIRLPSGLDDAQLVTIVGNLLDNALDAVADVSPDRRIVEVTIGADHHAFRVEVRDLGVGLSHSLEEMRTAGFSTKPGHVGAGLALVDRIASVAGGSLESHSDGRGTSFVVTIPVREADP